MKIILLLLCMLPLVAVAQVHNTTELDTAVSVPLNRLTIMAGADVYFAYDPAQTSGQRPYGVSYTRLNEFALNLAYVEVAYTDERTRARVVPAFGSYMAANYAAEPPAFQYLLEANGGLRLSERGNVWLDAGILGSPYTNEGPVGFHQLMLTRSFSAEHVPYYLSGLKLSAQLNPALHASLYLLNGWQNIAETNTQKSLGTQLEWRPTQHLLLNWNTYAGYEGSQLQPTFRSRYFTDVYAIYEPNDNWSFSSCVYLGYQQLQANNYSTWGNANIIGRYTWNNGFSLAGRYEYFNDSRAVVTENVVITEPKAGLFTHSASLCVGQQVGRTAIARVELRQFFGGERNFINENGIASTTSTWLTAGVAWQI